METNAELEELKRKFALLEKRVQDLEASDRGRAEKYLEDDEVNRLFEELTAKVSSPSLQRIIRETSIDDWARASVGLSLDPLSKIRSSVSVRAWEDFKERAMEIEN